MSRADSLGPCCMCEGTVDVRNIISLHRKSPTPGRGWGCVQCGLPPDGAIAVLCDRCLALTENGEPLNFACKGYPATDGRVPIMSLHGEHDHDFSRHPEIK